MDKSEETEHLPMLRADTHACVSSQHLPGGGRETAGLEMLLGGVSTTEVLYVLVWVMVALRGYVGSMAIAMLGNAD
jgi:hypothetical protein